MIILSSRISKLLIGSTLILITLTQEYTGLQGYALLSLFAIPFILSGLFDWRPLQYVLDKIELQTLLSLSEKVSIRFIKQARA